MTCKSSNRRIGHVLLIIDRPCWPIFYRLCGAIRASCHGRTFSIGLNNKRKESFGRKMLLDWSNFRSGIKNWSIFTGVSSAGSRWISSLLGIHPSDVRAMDACLRTRDSNENLSQPQQSIKDPCTEPQNRSITQVDNPWHVRSGPSYATIYSPTRLSRLITFWWSFGLHLFLHFRFWYQQLPLKKKVVRVH